MVWRVEWQEECNEAIVFIDSDWGGNLKGQAVYLWWSVATRETLHTDMELNPIGYSALIGRGGVLLSG